MLGLDGWLPWDIPEELAYFEETVAGAALVIGRLTYESMDVVPGLILNPVVIAVLIAQPGLILNPVVIAVLIAQPGLILNPVGVVQAILFLDLESILFLNASPFSRLLRKSLWSRIHGPKTTRTCRTWTHTAAGGDGTAAGAAAGTAAGAAATAAGAAGTTGTAAGAAGTAGATGAAGAEATGLYFIDHRFHYANAKNNSEQGDCNNFDESRNLVVHGEPPNRFDSINIPKSDKNFYRVFSLP